MKEKHKFYGKIFLILFSKTSCYVHKRLRTEWMFNSLKSSHILCSSHFSLGLPDTELFFKNFLNICTFSVKSQWARKTIFQICLWSHFHFFSEIHEEHGKLALSLSNIMRSWKLFAWKSHAIQTTSDEIFSIIYLNHNSIVNVLEYNTTDNKLWVQNTRDWYSNAYKCFIFLKHIFTENVKLGHNTHNGCASICLSNNNL